MTSPHQETLLLAVEAVRAASRACLHVQQHRLDGDEFIKGDRSPVTVADFAVQAVVSDWLHEHTPQLPIVGEETTEGLHDRDGAETRQQLCEAVEATGSQLSEAEILKAIDRCSGRGGAQGLHWVLDPIDGTKGFLRRGQYAIALALLEDGVPVLGVLGCPALPLIGDSARADESPAGALFSCERNQGAWQEALDPPVPSSRCRCVCSSVQEPEAAAFCESVEAAHSSHSTTARIAELLGVTSDPVRIDSQCKYATVARGEASIYLRLPTSAEYRERIWDHAAGALLVAEAGGSVTDVNGRELDFSLGRRLEDNRGIIATNGSLHARVLAAVKTALTESTTS